MLNKNEAAKRQFADAKNWYRDRYQYVLVWRNILFVISTLSLAGVTLAVLAIAKLTPAKTVEPFVIQVDEKTGMTQVVNSTDIKALNTKHVLDQYFIAQYVRARESYDAIATESRANAVRLMSTNQLYSRYYETIDPKRDSSLYVKFNTQTSRDIKITSIVFLDETTAQVRMTATDTSFVEGVKNTVAHSLIATMKFEYAKINLKTEERYINPLGFRVVMYNLVEENL